MEICLYTCAHITTTNNNIAYITTTNNNIEVKAPNHRYDRKRGIGYDLCGKLK